MTTRLAWALRYLDLGYHPVPVARGGKRPLVEWRAFQQIAPTREQVTAWWTEWPDANIALVMGRGCFALDFDGGAEAETLVAHAGIELPTAPKSRTGSGGAHVLLAGDCGDRVALFSTNGHTAQVDVRGVGIIVVPPSIHPNGKPYVWEVPPVPVADLPQAPARLIALISRVGSSPAAPGPAAPPLPRPESWVAEALLGVPEGQRDDTCARLAGYLLNRGLSAEVVEALLLSSFARNCVPPFPQQDVRKTVQSIARRDAASGAADRDDLAPVALRDVLHQLLTEMDAGPPRSTPTPFRALNRRLDGGFSPGELIYLGARPGVGKTALALEVARSASQQGPVLIVSREMVNTALARRMVAQAGHIRASALKQHALSPADYEAFSHALVQLGDLDLWLTDDAISLPEIATLVSRPPRSPWHLVIVDYLQLVRAPREVKERRLQVEAVSQGLKTLAVQFKVPVLCLSSLRRPAKGNPRPTLADLRESGELEHDADVVMFLHRADEAETGVECNVMKNRDGGLGRVLLRFRPEWVAFDEWTETDE